MWQTRGSSVAVAEHRELTGAGSRLKVGESAICLVGDLRVGDLGVGDLAIWSEEGPGQRGVVSVVVLLRPSGFVLMGGPA